MIDPSDDDRPGPSPTKNERKQLTTQQRLTMFVRCGGRCALCNRYLLEGEMSQREVTFGEVAHIIGLQATETSPRGLDEDLDEEARNDPENLMLICENEHEEIDKPGTQDMFPTAWLRQVKSEHEARIFYLTGLGPQRETVPIRMVGQLRGRPTQIDRESVAQAVIQSAMRFPRFRLSDRNAIDIDLREIPGEAAAGTDYYATACAKIDEVLDHNLRTSLLTDAIKHMSVFAFARLPLLVYLGSKLDDNTPTDIYQLHRSTNGWSWPSDTADVHFAVDVPETQDAPTEAVLIVNVTGTIHVGELPSELASLPRMELAIDGDRHPDSIRSQASLAAFEGACRTLTGRIEGSGYKSVERLHVLAVMGVSPAVTFGRVFDPDVHPTLVLYDRQDDGSYTPAMEVGKR